MLARLVAADESTPLTSDGFEEARRRLDDVQAELSALLRRSLTLEFPQDAQHFATLALMTGGGRAWRVRFAVQFSSWNDLALLWHDVSWVDGPSAEEVDRVEDALTEAGFYVLRDGALDFPYSGKAWAASLTPDKELDWHNRFFDYR